MRIHTFLDLCRELRINTIEYSTNSETIQRWEDEGRNLGLFDGDLVVQVYDIDEDFVEFRDGKITCASKPFQSLPIELYQLVDRLGSGRINFYLADDLNLPNGYRVIDYEE